jgi:hypothetical protein
MRRRRLWLVLGLVLTLAGGAAGWWLLHSPPRITEATYEQIRDGMALAEVEAILGGPPGNYDGEEPRQYIPRHILCSGAVSAVIMVDDLGQVNQWPEQAFRGDVTDAFSPSQYLSVGRIVPVEEALKLPRPARTVLWTGPKYAIAVQLDAGDHVVNACLAVNYGPSAEPAWWQRLLARVGIG